MMFVRELYHEGAPKPTSLKLNSATSPEFKCFPSPSETYLQLGKTRALQSRKPAHLHQMFNSYIPLKDFLTS